MLVLLVDEMTLSTTVDKILFNGEFSHTIVYNTRYYILRLIAQTKLYVCTCDNVVFIPVEQLHTLLLASFHISIFGSCLFNVI